MTAPDGLILNDQSFETSGYHCSLQNATIVPETKKNISETVTLEIIIVLSDMFPPLLTSPRSEIIPPVPNLWHHLALVWTDGVKYKIIYQAQLADKRVLSDQPIFQSTSTDHWSWPTGTCTVDGWKLTTAFLSREGDSFAEQRPRLASSKIQVQGFCIFKNFGKQLWNYFWLGLFWVEPYCSLADRKLPQNSATIGLSPPTEILN